MIKFVNTEKHITTVLRDMGLKIDFGDLVPTNRSSWIGFLNVVCEISENPVGDVELTYSNMKQEPRIYEIAMELEENGIAVTLIYTGQL